MTSRASNSSQLAYDHRPDGEGVRASSIDEAGAGGPAIAGGERITMSNACSAVTMLTAASASCRPGPIAGEQLGDLRGLAGLGPTIR
jgi:hypothetical protein